MNANDAAARYREVANASVHPVADVWSPRGEYFTSPDYMGGLTKREHFAGLAMQGLLTTELAAENPKLVAIIALNHADALVAALSQGEGQ